MSKPNRPNLAALLAESARKMKKQDSFDAQVKRITEAVKSKLAGDAAKKAETSRSLACPSCGAPLPESWRTDDVTSDDSSNDDEDNVGDRPDLPEEFDNRKAHRPLNGMTRDQVIASLGKIRC
jgi:hypothetical protein